MDKLTDKQRESVKKTNTERWRVKFLQSGAEEEKLFALDRKQLMDAVVALTVTNPEEQPDVKNALKEHKYN